MSNQYIATPLSRNKIRNITYQLRKIVGLENELYLPVLPLIEIVLPKSIEGFDYQIVENHELPSQYALAIPEENQLLIREDVYERAYTGVARDRFTIAHEIGHLILHTDNRITLARNSSGGIKPYENPEWQANTFAGELLVPAHLTTELDLFEITQKCGVSTDVASIQMKHRK